MERDSTTPNSAVAQTKKGRFTSPLVINSASQRRGLFSRTRTKEDPVRLASSGALSDTRSASPSNTKIPRPVQRGPFTLSDAYRMAEEEEVAQGSPSPAPRLWRSRREPGEKRASRLGSTGSSETRLRGGLDRKSLESGHEDGADDFGARSQQSDISDSAFDEKLRQYALDKTSPDVPGRRTNSLLSKSRLGTKIVETGKGLVRKTSRGSLDSSSSPRPAKATPNGTWLSRRLSGRKRESGDPPAIRESADWAQPGDGPYDEPLPPDTAFPESHTPNKSFAWEADADFTAGDLQISNSPRVAIGRSNTKIEEIRALEAEVNGRISDSPQPRGRNTRIDEIRALEADAAVELPNKGLDSDEVAIIAQETMPEGEDKATRSRSLSRTRAGTDESRSREIERLSRRALATARLDQLRERNITTTSRSPSPDVARKSIKEPSRAYSPLGDRLRRRESKEQASLAQPQQAPAGQSTVVPAPHVRDHSPANATGEGNDRATSRNRESRRRASQTGDEPHDLRRRLGLATSTNPIPEPQAGTESEPLIARGRDAGEGTGQKRRSGGVKSDVKPTVGFVGLQRSTSIESRLAKRASFVHSDSDPTERIEGEMDLFAPMENQSERGSIRAPSPEPERGAVDETPRAVRPDPLTQPTPTVTGAFVDTPATIKAEKVGNHVATATAAQNTGEPQINSLEPPSQGSRGDTKHLLGRDKRDGAASRQQERRQSTGADRLPTRSSSLSARRRARSLSRGRTPLINSAKLPTVKDDLLEIQRANQIEDSTLDDLADLLAHQIDSGSDLDSHEAKVEEDNTDKLAMEKELEAYARMSRSLKTGLLGIRTAKQGIERLEGRVSHADVKESVHVAHGDSTPGADPSCPDCVGSQANPPTTGAYVHLALPLLWYRRPKFRFTFLGLTLFLLSLWYIAESWMCFVYCKPQYCSPDTPCDWSPDDPVWGYAIPVKLDQWVAGGQGRVLARRLAPDVADWVADLWDAATGTDMTAVDTSRYSWEQRRQHRRRLAKRGLSKPFVEQPEDKAKFSAWKAARVAREKAQSAQEMGYEIDDDIIGDDEKL